MNSSIVLFSCLVFAICINISFGAYVREDPVCYGSVCPMGTTRCKKHIESTNRGFLEITINCLDAFGGSLKEYHYENPSSLGPTTQYHSTSFTDIRSNQYKPQPYRVYNNEAADLMGYGY